MTAPLTPPGPPPEFRLVPPPADGLETAFRAAASRRRRKAATASGTGVAAALVAFAVLTGGSGQVLTQDPLPPADQLPGVVEVVPSDAATPEPVATRAAPTTGGGSALAPTTGGAPVVGTTSAPRATPRPAAPRPPRASAYRVADMKRSGPSLTLPVNCARTEALCSDVVTSSRDIRVTLCSTLSEPVHLDFAAKDEVDVVVTLVDEVVWQWSAGRPRESDPHQVTLDTGECLDWTTEWTGVDQQGRKLPKGGYAVLSVVDSPDAGDAREATTTYQVS